MKIPKFRAQIHGSNEFTYSDKDPANFWYGVNEGNIDGDTVVQFTGMLDKNGKEIYNGDKVKVTLSETEIYTGEVEYHDTGASYWFTSDPYIKYGLQNSTSFPLLQCSKNEVEVI